MPCAPITITSHPRAGKGFAILFGYYCAAGAVIYTSFSIVRKSKTFYRFFAPKRCVIVISHTAPLNTGPLGTWTMMRSTSGRPTCPTPFSHGRRLYCLSANCKYFTMAARMPSLSSESSTLVWWLFLYELVDVISSIHSTQLVSHCNHSLLRNPPADLHHGMRVVCYA